MPGLCSLKHDTHNEIAQMEHKIPTYEGCTESHEQQFFVK